MSDATLSRLRLVRLTRTPSPEDLEALADPTGCILGAPPELELPEGLAVLPRVALDPTAPAHAQWAALVQAAPAARVILLEQGERLSVTGEPPANVGAAHHVRVVRPDTAWRELRALDLRAPRPAFLPAPPGEVRPDNAHAVAEWSVRIEAPACVVASPESPDASPLDAYLHGRALAEGGDPHAAFSFLLTAVRAFAKDTTPWGERTLVDAASVLLECVCATRLGVEPTLELVLPLLNRLRDAAELWFSAAQLLLAAGQTDDASACLENTERALDEACDEWRRPNRLRIQPRWVHLMRGDLEFSRGARARAQHAYAAALRAWPAAADPPPPELVDAALGAVVLNEDRRDLGALIARAARWLEAPALIDRLRAVYAATSGTPSMTDRADWAAGVAAAAQGTLRADPAFAAFRASLLRATPPVERAVPRPATPRLRVLIGTENIAGYVEHLATGLRALGHEVETALATDNKFYGAYRPDRMARDFAADCRAVVQPDGDLHLALTEHAHAALTRFDVFVVVAAQSFAPGNVDLPLLADAGVRIVSWLPGSESRHWSAAETLWREAGSTLPAAVRDRGHRNTSTRRMDVIGRGPYYDTLSNKLHNIRMAERYSDAVFGVPECMGHAVRPYFSIPAPLDLSKFRYRVPGREVPVVVHAPSHRGFKRTAELLEALERLRAEGVLFELRLLENLPHEVVVEELAEADVVLDQMSLYPAILAHEGMASGCAVLTGNVEYALPSPAPKPVVHIAPGALLGPLRQVLTDRALRIDLAEQGRAYVEAHCAAPVVAARLLAALAPDARPELYPAFFFEAARAPEGEVVPPCVHALTTQVLQAHGAPGDTDWSALAERGVVAPDFDARDVPTWRARLETLGPFVRAAVSEAP